MMADQQFGHAFVDATALLRRGTALADLDAGLAELLEAVEETGKPGTLTFTLKVTPQKNDPKTLTLTDTVKVNAPKHDVAATIAWLEKGRISRRDPRQPELPGVAEVPKGSTQAG